MVEEDPDVSSEYWEICEWSGEEDFLLRGHFEIRGEAERESVFAYRVNYRIFERGQPIEVYVRVRHFT